MPCRFPLAVISVSHPDEVLPGSRLRIHGYGFDDECGEVRALISGTIQGANIRHEMGVDPVSLEEITFELGADLFAQLAGKEGMFTGSAGVRIISTEGIAVEDSIPVRFNIVQQLQPELSSINSLNVTLNGVVSLSGNGLLQEGEGRTYAVLNGLFELDGGGSLPVSEARTQVRVVEENDRRRGYFLFVPQIAGIAPGTFDGTVRLINEHVMGGLLESNAIAVQLILGASLVSRINPPVTSLGGIITIEGAGFIGATPEETMTLKVEGTAYPYGSEPIIVENFELIANYIDGGRLQYNIIPVVAQDGRSLVAADFGFGRGSFVGTVTPILQFRGQVVEGIATEVRFELGPVKQVIFVEFTEDFSRTLRDSFGMKAVEQYVKDRVIEKLRETYEGINVDFRTEWPLDYYVGGFSRVEILGTDPNGRGLFGYDNTPGKDVWNLRLHDRIGGRNAETQEDGYPGFGGIFLDSVLCWSSRPDPEIVCPEGLEPEPAFDAIFDPVRNREVVVGEYPDGGDPVRVAQIGEAIRVLGNILGDTAAHEIGHSLGLAHPYGPPDLVHNEPPGPGCLMDAGAYRPFEERAELGGAPPGGWCGDERSYLETILPIR